MLSLAAPTPPGWAERVLADLSELLIDHAHCEKKAAGTALRLLFRYPRQAFLQEPLSRLAREELRHFEEVLAQLAQRGLALRPLHPSPYAGRLRREVRDGEPGRLVDTLLCSALIEARSCERFGLLAEAIREPELAAFYRGLFASEARHHGVYVGLAERLAPVPQVRARLAGLAAREAEILAGTPPQPRMHA
jgi:tRNA-(ms[2]io[6]A)-hydroxylase